MNKNGSSMAPVLQSFPEYISHHFMDELTEEVAAAITVGMVDGLDLYNEGQKLTVDSLSSKIVKMDIWRLSRTQVLTDIKMALKIGVIAEDEIPTYRVRHIYFAAVFTVDDGVTLKPGIQDVSAYLPEERHLVKMSKYLVPILTFEEMELLTQDMLRRYNGEKALHSFQIDGARRLAEAMGLNIMSLSLYHKKSTEGILFQKAGTARIVSECPFGDEDYDDIDVPAGTIVLNVNRPHTGDVEKAIYHECCHYEWHSMFFTLQELHCSDLRLLKYEEVEKAAKPREKDLRCLEKQASFVSIAAMFPRPVITPLIWKYWTPIASRSENLGWKIEYIINGIATESQKAKSLIRTRMICMGQSGAKGAYNYVDGKYITPFAFNTDHLHSGESFVISRAQLTELYERDAEFRDLISTHEFIYVDGHVCVNQPEFVRQYGKELQLTTWACDHVDECCLKFYREYAFSAYSDYQIGQLYSSSEYNDAYKLIHSVDVTGLAEDEIEDKNAEYLAKFPFTQTEAIKMLIQDRCGTQKELSLRTGISSSKISTMCQDEGHRFSIQDATKIIIGLRMPPPLSSRFLEVIGFPRTVMMKYYRYQCIIDCLFMDGVQSVIETHKSLFE